MTAKEKAIELTRDMYSVDVTNPSEYGMEWNMAKQCALLAADEVLGWMGADRGTEFWVEVKREIQEL